jgi:hypothetical protein
MAGKDGLPQAATGPAMGCRHLSGHAQPIEQEIDK